MPVNDVDTSDPAAARMAAAGRGEAGDPEAQKRTYVRSMFSQIAPRYDFLNHLLSFSLDRAWRRRAIAALEWQRAPDGVYVDLCAGTLDVAARIAREPRFGGCVVGADFAEPMLRAGRGKAPAGIVWPVVSDALELPLPNDCASGAIVAFGIRNVANLDAGLREMHRVLKPGGRFVILEFTTPRSPVVRAAYHAYFHHLVPVIGGFMSGHRTAYRYLPDSVANFPTEEELATRLARAGFARVTWQTLTLGVAAIHVADKGASGASRP